MSGFYDDHDTNLTIFSFSFYHDQYSNLKNRKFKTKFYICKSAKNCEFSHISFWSQGAEKMEIICFKENLKEYHKNLEMFKIQNI